MEVAARRLPCGDQLFVFTLRVKVKPNGQSHWAERLFGRHCIAIKIIIINSHFVFLYCVRASIVRWKSFLFVLRSSLSLADCAIWSCVLSRGRRRHHHHRLNCSGWLKWVRLESVVIWFELKQAVAATAESIIIIKTHLRAQSWPQSDFLSIWLRGHLQFDGEKRGSELTSPRQFRKFLISATSSSSDTQSVNGWLAVSVCDWNVSALERRNTFGFITCHCQLITEQSHRLYNSNFEMGKTYVDMMLSCVLLTRIKQQPRHAQHSFDSLNG